MARLPNSSMTRSTIWPLPSTVSSSRPCDRRDSCAPDLPQAITVDYSLAEHFEHTWLTRGHPSRRWTAVVRAFLPNRHGFGFTRTDFARDARSWTWVLESLLTRADSTSVAGWATRAHVPDIAYTFWLGAQTVGLRDAWPGVPLVSRAHRHDLYAQAHGWNSIPFQAASVRSVDLLAAVSEDGRTYLANSYPESADKIVVRRLGVRDLGLPTGGASHSALTDPECLVGHACEEG